MRAWWGSGQRASGRVHPFAQHVFAGGLYLILWGVGSGGLMGGLHDEAGLSIRAYLWTRCSRMRAERSQAWALFCALRILAARPTPPVSLSARPGARRDYSHDRALEIVSSYSESAPGPWRF
eukprot:6186736-Prymnesium_polylepis.1